MADMRCRSCGLTKPEEMYHRNKISKTGRRGSCKACVKRKVEERKRAVRERAERSLAAAAEQKRAGQELERAAGKILDWAGKLPTCRDARVAFQAAELLRRIDGMLMRFGPGEALKELEAVGPAMPACGWGELAAYKELLEQMWARRRVG